MGGAGTAAWRETGVAQSAGDEELLAFLSDESALDRRRTGGDRMKLRAGSSLCMPRHRAAEGVTPRVLVRCLSDI